MTRDEIIALAREAGDDVEHTLPSDMDFLERFARLVAAAERKTCIKIEVAKAGLTESAA